MFFTCSDCERIACVDACLVMIDNTPYCRDCAVFAHHVPLEPSNTGANGPTHSDRHEAAAIGHSSLYVEPDASLGNAPFANFSLWGPRAKRALSRLIHRVDPFASESEVQPSVHSARGSGICSSPPTRSSYLGRSTGDTTNNQVDTRLPDDQFPSENIAIDSVVSGSSRTWCEEHRSL